MSCAKEQDRQNQSQINMSCEMSITRPVIYIHKSCYIDLIHAYIFAGNKHDSSSLVSPDDSCSSHTDERVPRTSERAKDKGNKCAQVSGKAREQKQEL